MAYDSSHQEEIVISKAKVKPSKEEHKAIESIEQKPPRIRRIKQRR